MSRALGSRLMTGSQFLQLGHVLFGQFPLSPVYSFTCPIPVGMWVCDLCSKEILTNLKGGTITFML